MGYVLSLRHPHRYIQKDETQKTTIPSFLIRQDTDMNYMATFVSYYLYQIYVV